MILLKVVIVMYQPVDKDQGSLMCPGTFITRFTTTLKDLVP